MSEIPDDVMDAAWAVAEPYALHDPISRPSLASDIARAIMAERQRATDAERKRCAEVCESHWEENDKITKAPGWDSACISVKRTILNPPSAASSRAE